MKALGRDVPKERGSPWPEFMALDGKCPESEEVRFTRLAAQWKKETSFLATLRKRYKHPSYKAILNMGKRVIPFILEELRRDPDRWFSALTELSGDDPAKDSINFYEAVDRWISWGIEHGHIPD